MNTWNHPFRTYTGRPGPDGVIYSMSSPMWLVLLLYCIILLNVLGWGVVGLIELVQYFF